MCTCFILNSHRDSRGSCLVNDAPNSIEFKSNKHTSRPVPTESGVEAQCVTVSGVVSV